MGKPQADIYVDDKACRSLRELEAILKLEGVFDEE
jgi:hypothetical protein